MGKRKCTFNDKLAKTYPFIKKAKLEGRVECNKCKSEFSIASGGKIDIEQHIKTEKHSNVVAAASSSNTLDKFLKGPTSDDEKTAALEGLWAYHTIAENHSFRSTDCSSKIFRDAFEMKKFTLGRTKCEAIVTNVFAPFAASKVKEELAKCNFVSIATDASNHGNIKMFPVMMRYFIPTEGVKIKIIEFVAQSNETGVAVFDLLNTSIDSNNAREKLIAFFADNAPTNFGSVNRTGERNVFHRLKEQNPNILGIGCLAHILHNSIDFACDQLPIDVEVTVVKLYSHFYRSASRVEELKSVCNSRKESYHQLLGYSSTRFWQ